MSCSVLLPVYSGDCPEYLRLALESFVTQTKSVGEIIIILDGVVPSEIHDVVKSFTGILPIRDLQLPENVGLGAALNAGLETARYQLIMRMDADDVNAETRVQAQIDFMDANPEIDILGSYAVEIDLFGKRGGLRKMPVSHHDICESLWLCPLIHPTVTFRKDRVLSVGGYNPSLRRRQDYELWFRCAQNGLRFANITEPLLYYRFDSSSHKKQSVRLAFQQGKIGFRGSSSLGLSIWKRIGCFFPFLRALFPVWLQHRIYRIVRVFDPRQT